MTGSTGSGADWESGLTYGQALDELERLLAELESAEVDVDRLAQQVARGVELVRFCQHRLAVVTADVDQVVADLAQPETDEPGNGVEAESDRSGG